MRSKGGRFQINRSNPIAHDPCILSCRNMKPFVKPSRSRVLRADHQRIFYPLHDGDASTLRIFIPDRLLSFALRYRCPFFDLPRCHHIDDLHFNQVTSPQLAVDAILKRARSRWFPASSSLTRIAQTCFGLSGQFWPTMRPLFQAMRSARIASKLGIRMLDSPIRHALPKRRPDVDER